MDHHQLYHYIPTTVASRTTLENASLMRGCYRSQFAFPAWTLDETLWSEFLFNETIVYYHHGADVKQVAELVYKREPTNIRAQNLYTKETLNTHFCYSTGVHSTQSPNLAIYCHAHVKTKAGMFRVHVINLIGLGFCSKKQPDYQRFMPGNKPDMPRILQFYARMWQFLQQCVIDHPQIRAVKFYNVGGGCFRGPLDNFVTSVFEPAFKDTREFLQKHKIQLIGGTKVDDDTVTEGGFIPDDVGKIGKQDELDTILYINAWDPFSMIGNGNASDHSLDGYWGRSSNMAVLGWSATNRQMKMKEVELN